MVSVDLPLAEVIAGDDGLAAIDAVYDSNASGSSVSTLEGRVASRLALAPPGGAPASFAAVSLQRGRDAA